MIRSSSSQMQVASWSESLGLWTPSSNYYHAHESKLADLYPRAAQVLEAKLRRMASCSSLPAAHLPSSPSRELLVASCTAASHLPSWESEKIDWSSDAQDMTVFMNDSHDTNQWSRHHVDDHGRLLGQAATPFHPDVCSGNLHPRAGELARNALGGRPRAVPQLANLSSHASSSSTTPPQGKSSTAAAVVRRVASEPGLLLPDKGDDSMHSLPATGTLQKMHHSNLCTTDKLASARLQRWVGKGPLTEADENDLHTGRPFYMAPPGSWGPLTGCTSPSDRMADSRQEKPSHELGQVERDRFLEASMLDPCRLGLVSDGSQNAPRYASGTSAWPECVSPRLPIASHESASVCAATPVFGTFVPESPLREITGPITRGGLCDATPAFGNTCERVHDSDISRGGSFAWGGCGRVLDDDGWKEIRGVEELEGTLYPNVPQAFEVSTYEREPRLSSAQEPIASMGHTTHGSLCPPHRAVVASQQGDQEKSCAVGDPCHGSLNPPIVEGSGGNLQAYLGGLSRLVRERNPGLDRAGDREDIGDAPSSSVMLVREAELGCGWGRGADEVREGLQLDHSALHMPIREGVHGVSCDQGDVVGIAPHEANEVRARVESNDGVPQVLPMPKRVPSGGSYPHVPFGEEADEVRARLESNDCALQADEIRARLESDENSLPVPMREMVYGVDHGDREVPSVAPHADLHATAGEPVDQRYSHARFGGEGLEPTYHGLNSTSRERSGGVDCADRSELGDAFDRSLHMQARESGIGEVDYVHREKVGDALNGNLPMQAPEQDGEHYNYSRLGGEAVAVGERLDPDNCNLRHFEVDAVERSTIDVVPYGFADIRTREDVGGNGEGLLALDPVYSNSGLPLSEHRDRAGSIVGAGPLGSEGHLAPHGLPPEAEQRSINSAAHLAPHGLPPEVEQRDVKSASIHASSEAMERVEASAHAHFYRASQARPEEADYAKREASGSVMFIGEHGGHNYASSLEASRKSDLIGQFGQVFDIQNQDQGKGKAKNKGKGPALPKGAHLAPRGLPPETGERGINSGAPFAPRGLPRGTEERGINSGFIGASGTAMERLDPVQADMFRLSKARSEEVDSAEREASRRVMFIGERGGHSYTSSPEASRKSDEAGRTSQDSGLHVAGDKVFEFAPSAHSRFAMVANETHKPPNVGHSPSPGRTVRFASGDSDGNSAGRSRQCADTASVDDVGISRGPAPASSRPDLPSSPVQTAAKGEAVTAVTSADQLSEDQGKGKDKHKGKAPALPKGAHLAPRGLPLEAEETSISFKFTDASSRAMERLDPVHADMFGSSKARSEEVVYGEIEASRQMMFIGDRAGHNYAANFEASHKSERSGDADTNADTNADCTSNDDKVFEFAPSIPFRSSGVNRNSEWAGSAGNDASMRLNADMNSAIGESDRSNAEVLHLQAPNRYGSAVGNVYLGIDASTERDPAEDPLCMLLRGRSGTALDAGHAGSEGSMMPFRERSGTAFDANYAGNEGLMLPFRERAGTSPDAGHVRGEGLAMAFRERAVTSPDAGHVRSEGLGMAFRERARTAVEDGVEGTREHAQSFNSTSVPMEDRSGSTLERALFGSDIGVGRGAGPLSDESFQLVRPKRIKRRGSAPLLGVHEDTTYDDKVFEFAPRMRARFATSPDSSPISRDTSQGPSKPDSASLPIRTTANGETVAPPTTAPQPTEESATQDQGKGKTKGKGKPPAPAPKGEAATGKGKGKGKVPAPPPAPKGKDGGKGKGGAPPPKASQGVAKEEAKAKAAPRAMPKTKPFMWRKIEAANEGTLWALNRSCMDDFQVDPEQIEALFSWAQPPKLLEQATASGAKEEEKAKEKIKLTSKERVMGICIGLRCMKNLGFDGIRQAILDLDSSKLTSEATERLLMCDAKSRQPTVLPTTQELAAARAHVSSGVPDDLLDEASRFIVAVHDIPHLRDRLFLHQFRLSFDETAAGLRQELSLLRTALQQVRESKGFASILMYVLKAGNILNDGTERGNASGFRMDSLAALTLLKGHKGQAPGLPKSGTTPQGGALSLVDYLVGVIEQQRPQLLEDVPKELKDVAEASRLELEEIVRNASEKRKELQKIAKSVGSSVNLDDATPRAQGVEEPSTGSDSADPGLAGASEFLSQTMGTLDSIDQDVEEVKQAYKEVSEFFGEQRKSKSDQIPLHEWLGFITRFLAEMQKAVTAHRLRVERAKRAEAQQAQKAIRGGRKKTLIYAARQRDRKGSGNLNRRESIVSKHGKDGESRLTKHRGTKKMDKEATTPKSPAQNVSFELAMAEAQEASEKRYAGRTTSVMARRRRRIRRRVSLKPKKLLRARRERARQLVLKYRKVANSVFVHIPGSGSNSDDSSDAAGDHNTEVGAGSATSRSSVASRNRNATSSGGIDLPDAAVVRRPRALPERSNSRGLWSRLRLSETSEDRSSTSHQRLSKQARKSPSRAAKRLAFDTAERKSTADSTQNSERSEQEDQAYASSNAQAAWEEGLVRVPRLRQFRTLNVASNSARHRTQSDMVASRLEVPERAHAQRDPDEEHEGRGRVRSLTWAGENTPPSPHLALDDVAITHIQVPSAPETEQSEEQEEESEEEGAKLVPARRELTRIVASMGINVRQHHEKRKTVPAGRDVVDSNGSEQVDVLPIVKRKTAPALYDMSPTAVNEASLTIKIPSSGESDSCCLGGSDSDQAVSPKESRRRSSTERMVLASSSEREDTEHAARELHVANDFSATWHGASSLPEKRLPAGERSHARRFTVDSGAPATYGRYKPSEIGAMLHDLNKLGEELRRGFAANGPANRVSNPSS